MLSLVLLSGTSAFAEHSTNVLVRDDAECVANGYDFGYKLDGVDEMDASDNGTYISDDHFFSVDLAFHEEGAEITSFDFDDAEPPVSGVLVVGGPPGPDRVRVYDYVPPAESDEGLERTGGGGISHITFCFLEAEPTPTPTDEPTPTPTDEPTPTPTDEPTPTPKLTPPPTSTSADGGNGTNNALLVLLVGAMAGAWLLLRPMTPAPARAARRHRRSS